MVLNCRKCLEINPEDTYRIDNIIKTKTIIGQKHFLVNWEITHLNSILGSVKKTWCNIMYLLYGIAGVEDSRNLYLVLLM